MDDKDNRNKERTSEEYRQEAEEHMESLKQGWKVFGGTGIFVIAALVAVILIALAWFVYNRTVTSESSSISAKQKGYELGSEGTLNISSGLEEHLDASVLSWKLKDNSNLQNCEGQDGIRPNTSGSLSFYVIPYSDDPLIINCTLDIRPVMNIGDEGDSEIAKKILCGHLLFECEYTHGETIQKCLVDVEDGTFQIKLPNAKTNERQDITLNWFWPYTLYDAENHDVYGNEISAMTGDQKYFDYFFYDNTSTADVNSSFKILNQCYNNADQFIGEKVNAMVLELTAQQEL